jgi:hypothetical protein
MKNPDFFSLVSRRGFLVKRLKLGLIPYISHSSAAFDLNNLLEKALTHEFRSEDPRDFGKNRPKAQALYVGTIPCAASEVYQVEGNWCLSSNQDPKTGTQISGLIWEVEA